MTNPADPNAPPSDEAAEPTITLEAYAADERRAFYSRREENKIRFFAFIDPDGKDSEVSKETVEYAVSTVGWRAANKPLTRPELIAFLRAESIRAMDELRGGKPPPSMDELRERLLNLYSPDELEARLTQAEGRLSGNDAARAQDLLRALLGAKNLTEAQRRKIQGLLANPSQGPTDAEP